MWFFLTALATVATADEGCHAITLSDILAVPPPAVIVLGERRGTQPDLLRAKRVVNRLNRRSPVTLAIEAVHSRYQPVLDEFAAGTITALELPGRMNWDQSWGYPWEPYEPLVTAATRGVNVVAAGVDVEAAPEGVPYPVPGGYMTVLRDAMSGHDLPLRMESRFIQTMSWHDHRIASTAIDGWNQEGYLVVVTNRTRVEGGKGVGWQLDMELEQPVHQFVLAWGVEPPCLDGDQVWKPGFIEAMTAKGTEDVAK